MYLKHLDIHGFKTFAEKTQIVFTPGVTCIVGPNGSGKSNISDAILWVLGENNVRSLRGQTAQDIIFAGNDKRRPLGMAEVSLTLDNSAGILPLDFSEITVTRRLYRSGEAECFINKVSCRLKDIYELFLDTGVGRDAYSMINQGQIDQILSVRAEDRRAIFEEAAGIKKYRVRKREAERKLEHTQQNLLRVNDIVIEIEAQLGPLQRQATAAKRYRELAVKLRDLETAWYGAKLKRLNHERESLAKLVAELNDERKRLDTELKEAQEAEKVLQEELRRLDLQGEGLRAQETAALQRTAAAEAERARAEERAGEVQRRLRALEKELDEVGGRIEEQVRRSEATAREEAQLKREVDDLRGTLRDAQGEAQARSTSHEAAVKDLERQRQAWLARERQQAELKARVQSLESRRQSLEAEQRRAVPALEDAEAELQRLTAERESFVKAAGEQKDREKALAAELEAAREAARKADQEVAAARGISEKAQREYQSHAARLQALSELGERGEGAAAGAKTLLDGVRRGNVTGRFSLLVDGITVPEGLEKAVEAALGIYGDAVLCDTEAEALAALRWLKGRRATALLLVGTPQSAPTVLPHSLGAQVAGEGAGAEWARLILARTAVCNSLEAVAEARAETAEQQPDQWVTRTGEWATRAGAMSGGVAGAEGSAAAALSRGRELERLRAEGPPKELAAETAREAFRTAETEARKSQAALREKQSLSERIRTEYSVQAREADRRQADLERARQRVERQRADLARIERDQAAAAQSLAQAVEQQQRVELAPAENASAPAPSEAAVTQAQQALRALEAAWRAAENRVTEMRVKLAQQEQRLQGAVAASRRAVEAGAFMDRQRSDRLREQRTLVAESEQREISYEALTQTVGEAQADIAKTRAEMAALAEVRTARVSELSGARGRSQDLGGRLRELMERCHRAEVELTAVDTQRGHLGQQWLDASVSGHSLEALQAEEGDEPLTFTVEALLEAWDPAAADLTLTSYSDPEGEINRLRRQIRSLGAVNPDAVEQYAESKERFDFLTSQRADLESAREKLEGAIREIDLASRETFLRAFHEIAEAFDEMFKKLFGGGTTELKLTDPNDVLETGIDVIVQPPGKKQQNLLLLSGGERALTAAAMLFALLKVKPSPFCVMDEVDAPLDEGNVGRFSGALRDFSLRTQFVVVTHNRGTMEGADTLYGVTMEERGVSKVLSCTLQDPMVAQIEAEQRGAGRN